MIRNKSYLLDAVRTKFFIYSAAFTSIKFYLVYRAIFFQVITLEGQLLLLEQSSNNFNCTLCRHTQIYVNVHKYKNCLPIGHSYSLKVRSIFKLLSYWKYMAFLCIYGNWFRKDQAFCPLSDSLCDFGKLSS